MPLDRDPKRVCALIEAADVQVLSTSPSFLRLLWASGAAEGRNLSSLAVVTYGSEPMDAATLRRINELFPAARISQKYGSTETGAPRTISRSNDSLWVQIAAKASRRRSGTVSSGYEAKARFSAISMHQHR